VNARIVKVLVLGGSGMLGNTVLRLFADSPGYDVVATLRSPADVGSFVPDLRERLIPGVDIDDLERLTQLIVAVEPDVVINCIGVVKQLAEADDPLIAIPINALLPHRLAKLCLSVGARLVHISTDCVFSGAKGRYTEADLPDAQDLYGRSKLLGEVSYSHTVTLRTSIIGHELNSARGLVCWFLAQREAVKGYTRAIFSGFPAVELAQIIRDVVIPDDGLSGLYHVAAHPIDKCALLRLIAEEYGVHTAIIPDSAVVIDRSLDASRFQRATGYRAPEWPVLVARMHNFK
jgi:dTDP-4-dehydrorhamnose reductase